MATALAQFVCAGRGVAADWLHWARHCGRDGYLRCRPLQSGSADKAGLRRCVLAGCGRRHGTLISLGPKARLPVALAVLVASAAAGLLKDGNFPAAIVFSLCNAGEALLVAWLITQRFGQALGWTACAMCSRSSQQLGSGQRSRQSRRRQGSAFLLQFGRAGCHHLAELVRLLDALGIIIVAPLLIGLFRLRTADHRTDGS